MKENILSKKTLNSMYLEDIILYFLFSLLKFSIAFKKYHNSGSNATLNAFISWISNSKLSKNGYAFICLETIENVYTVLRFLTKFTHKVEILQFSDKSDLELNSGFIYLTLKNNIRKIQTSTKFQHNFKKFPVVFSNINLLSSEFFLIEKTGKKTNFLFFNNFWSIESNFISFLSSEKNRQLIFKLRKKQKEVFNFSNYIKILPIQPFDFFVKLLKQPLVLNLSKILIIIDTEIMLKNFSGNLRRKTFSLITNHTSIHRKIKFLKKFNSNKKKIIIIDSVTWKKTNLYNRIDFRDIAAAFKIIGNQTKNNQWSIRTFLYF